VRGRWALAMVALVSLSGQAGCKSQVLTESQQAGDVVSSNLGRVSAESVPAEDVARLTADNGDFAFALLGALPSEDENLFYSPHSISTALALLFAGARGDTARELAHALHFGLEASRLHAAFNALDLALASRADTVPLDGGEPFRLSVVNQLWGQQGYEFLSSYLDLLAQYYGAGLRLLDFVADAEAARITINDWVSEETEGRIEDLIPEGAVDAATVLVLTNAIYFRASWARPFDPQQTRPSPFHRLDGSTLDVPTMSQGLAAGYAEGDGWRAAELTYSGDELSMVLLVPDSGSFDSFEASLDGPRARSIIEGLATRQLRLSMPLFEIRSRPALKSALVALGMRDAFGPGAADLSGIDGTRSLFVSDALHEGYVSVDEAGTEAAAATAVIIGVTAAPETAVLEVDRPFLFLIRDVPTGAILFVGRVVDPVAT
jgi:serpin B